MDDKENSASSVRDSEDLMKDSSDSIKTVFLPAEALMAMC